MAISSPARGSSATRRGYVPPPRRPRGGRAWTDYRLDSRDLSQSSRLLPSSKGLIVRILFSPTPTPGHLLPLLPLARAARVHGHDVAFLTGAGVTVDPGLRSGPLAVAREIAAMPSAEYVIARLANRLVEAA